MLLTVFTPTFNREHLLSRLYESLCIQTIMDFEWVIVDDGSTDGTRSLCQNWINEKKIRVRYFYQENSGKMMAHNRGVREAEGDLFLCVDSDDYLIKEAVYEIKKLYDKLQSLNLAGIIAEKGKHDLTPLSGKKLPISVKLSSLNKLYSKYGFKGDTTIVFKTSIIRDFMFPYIKGVKFIPENYVYDQIDEKYQYIIHPQILTICEYRDDGYSNNFTSLLKNNPSGFALYYFQRAKNSKRLKEQVINLSQYVSLKMYEQEYNWIFSAPRKYLLPLAIPCGLFLLTRRKKQFKLID
ncbi:glycosyltransferase family 2 protein [Fictibacillus sp. NRS-1165]|uniref:glycosyltransferase family 2 protein n=1 Tax=Fictibacillus sp. NRS-1165 TaxID=3144463 RepID=UPI003D1F39B3